MKNRARDLLLRSVITITRSLARFMLREGLGYAVFSDLARKSFVEAAEEFDIEGRQLSDSRIAVITGLSRKEVKRLRYKEHDDFIEDDSRHNRAVRVVTAWNRQPKYRTSQRKPRVLPLYGESPCLSELIAEFGGGVPVRALIDELSRVGAIVESRIGYWRLEKPAYIPNQSDETVMKILGTDVPLLIDTIDHNLHATPEEKRFQRKVCYDNLTVSQVEMFQQLAAKDSFALLKKFDQWLARAEPDPDAIPVSPAQRMRTGVGVFFFAEPHDRAAFDPTADNQSETI